MIRFIKEFIGRYIKRQPPGFPAEAVFCAYYYLDHYLVPGKHPAGEIALRLKGYILWLKKKYDWDLNPELLDIFITGLGKTLKELAYSEKLSQVKTGKVLLLAAVMAGFREVVTASSEALVECNFQSC